MVTNGDSVELCVLPTESERVRSPTQMLATAIMIDAATTRRRTSQRPNSPNSPTVTSLPSARLCRAAVPSRQPESGVSVLRGRGSVRAARGLAPVSAAPAAPAAGVRIEPGRSHL